MREALRLMAEHDHLRSAHLKAALAEGLEQANRGELLDRTAVERELRTALRKRSKKAKGK